MPLLHTAARRTLGAVAGVGLLGTSALAWGYVERRFPTLRRYDVFLPSTRNIDLRILHIADLHMFGGQEFIRDFLMRLAQEEEIDFVVSTGDNFGGHDGLALAVDAHAPFFDLPGAFVFGSNDYYSPERKSWTRYLRKDPRTARSRSRNVPDLPWEELRSTFIGAGWVDCSNASHSLPLTTATGPLTLALIGVDDPHIHRDRFPIPSPEWTNEQPDTARLRLGLTHAPYRRVLDAMTDAKADLILAGHTHGGQFGLPGVRSLVTNCDLPRAHGKWMSTWEHDASTSLLHVSAGLGTSPYVPFRIATRPEAALIHIRSV